ncbi:hypothetical protein [Maribacter sp. 2304DJ31-5]|uniref:hypothetical protein n=1 Tax=Maribacter sp. 2304DJ31-5 TaxID=3386273 RepID=UPI0039BC7E51
MIKYLSFLFLVLLFIGCSDNCTQTIEHPATVINGVEISPATTQEIPCDAEPIDPPIPIGQIN